MLYLTVYHNNFWVVSTRVLARNCIVLRFDYFTHLQSKTFPLATILSLGNNDHPFAATSTKFSDRQILPYEIGPSLYHENCFPSLEVLIKSLFWFVLNGSTKAVNSQHTLFFPMSTDLKVFPSLVYTKHKHLPPPPPPPSSTKISNSLVQYERNLTHPSHNDIIRS
jgi:hypothetical protein